MISRTRSGRLPAFVLTCVGRQKQSKSLPAVFVSVTAVCFLCLKIAHFVLCYAGMCMPHEFFALLNHYTTPAAASQQDQAGRGSADMPPINDWIRPTWSIGHG